MAALESTHQKSLRKVEKYGEFRLAHGIFEPGVQKSTVVQHAMRSVLIGSEYPVTATPHFLFPEKFILQIHICVKYQKIPFYFVTYSNSYKIAKKWLQNCRGGVVNSKDAGLRPLCERNATMKRGRGQTLGYFSPCGKEERKISDISRRTLVIGANLRQTARGRNTGPVRMTV